MKSLNKETVDFAEHVSNEIRLAAWEYTKKNMWDRLDKLKREADAILLAAAPDSPCEENIITMIFVFGSNLGGHHGAGAARVALLKHGAVYGLGVGPSGNSYAIPTKDERIESLPVERIAGYVDGFLEYAASHPEKEFQVTQIGCGLAGFTPDQIAPLFKDAPANCLFDEAWKPWFPKDDRPAARFWGTF